MCMCCVRVCVCTCVCVRVCVRMCVYVSTCTYVGMSWDAGFRARLEVYPARPYRVTYLNHNYI